MTADANPSWLDEPERPHQRRRRSPWPWIIVLVIVIALVIGAAVGAEAIARGVVQGGVRTLVASQVQVPAGQQIDVEVEGLVLPQLISGTLDEITVSAPDVELGPITGDVNVTARGVPIRADAPAEGGTATVRLDQAQLRQLLTNIDGFPADTVAIASPYVTASTELNLFGASIPVGLALTPGATDGRLTLNPASFQVAGAEVAADALRAQFGGIADAVLREWSICIADQLPSALTLTSVEVDSTNEVVATFDVDGRVVTDRSLLQSGTCA
jgi:hypothetical protein